MTTSGPEEWARQELLGLMAPQNGHFCYESGHHGSLWLHVDRPFFQPSRLQPLVRTLAHALGKHNVQVVCGPFVEGAFLAQMVACALELEFVYAEPFVLPEKDDLYPVKYRLPKTLRTAVAGKRIALVDDVINAGSAIRGTFVDLQACGARPVVLGALLVLGHSGPNFSAEQGLALECLARLPNNLWPPSKCPLCAANVPLDKIAETPLAP